MATNPHAGVLRDATVACLKQIIDPCSAANGTNFNLVEMGIVKEIDINNGEVCVKLRLTSPACFMLEFFSIEIRRRVGAVPGVTTVQVESDSGFEWEPRMMDQHKRREYLQALRRVLPVVKN
jgi:metal-sulfur cluster biosynthetic enzyme